MKIKSILLASLLAFAVLGCQITDFEDNYKDPSRVSETTIEKQFTGMIFSNREYVLPSYWNYFVVLRITLNRFNQATGWVNAENQYVPGSAAISDRWGNYYSFLAQYKELQKVYNALPEISKQEYRVYMIAATAYFYDHTQKVVDLHGDIPWSKAGMLSTNGGDFSKSYAEYDKAEDIYTKMLDDLKVFADELRTLTVPAAIQTGFKTQDLINRGDLVMWQKYVNSLRLRMLTRVSNAPSFSSRAKTEIKAILDAPAVYPIVATNADNILFRIHTLGTLISATDFQSGLEDWNGNIAGKAIVDHMVSNVDPRLPFIFEPGISANGVYMGLDPMLNPSVQNDLVGSNTLTIYNRSTFSRNQYFPGILMSASEVHLLAAEFYHLENPGKAKEHYEEAIRLSVRHYEALREMSNNNLVPAPPVATPAAITAYLGQPAVSWDDAVSATDRLKLISRQRWLHYNVIHPIENWADLRRLNVLGLSFWRDDSNAQSLPPSRWVYPGSEQTYNTQNYSKVQPNDNLNAKLFWMKN